MKRMVIVAVALLVVVSIALVTFAALRVDRPGTGKGATPSRNDAARAAPEPGLERFYDQTLDWKACGSNACATMEVPLDYANPEGDTIEIAVLKKWAREPSERVGSLVVNPGGPGAPGTSYAARGDSFFRPELTSRFDLVGFDPRGTGDSTAIDCVSDEGLDDFLAGDPDPDTPDEVAQAKRALTSFGAGCASRSGDLAGHVSTVEAARDMDVLRALLEEETLTYFGASYGTKLGATYAQLFPEQSGRLVLDGAVDVSLSSLDLGRQQAGGFETALTAYVENCLDTSDSCFLGNSVAEGKERISQFLDEVDAKPLTVGDRQLTQGLAFYGIAAPLYNRDYWFYLSTALKAAFDGKGQQLLALADAYASRAPDGSYLDNSMEAIYAINCLDDPSFVPAREIPELVPSFEQESPTFGRVFAWSAMSCVGQQVKSAEPAPEITGAGAPPIVVIGTTRDPATPYAWAEALASQLESGVLVSRDGDGHTGYNAGSGCVDGAVEAYLIDGDVPDDGLSC